MGVRRRGERGGERVRVRSEEGRSGNRREGKGGDEYGR